MKSTNLDMYLDTLYGRRSEILGRVEERAKNRDVKRGSKEAQRRM